LKLSPQQTAKQRAKLTRSRAFKAREREAGYVAVCLIGWEGPVPAYFGDNRGVWPCRITTTSKERTAAKVDDLSSPVAKVAVLECVHVESQEHARRLKAALDQMLLGEVKFQGNESLRHSWRDCNGFWHDEDTRGMWWGIVLAAALREVKKQARKFDVFDGDEKQRRIAQKVKRGR
jgi:hypothetical protein